mmetsp:Transcript_146019/g.257441  ORF Transcript_146019/g.257441 Transcript_146019/m.257441 type:complete len:98 (+) Transcript_146019:213-506(+)
MLPKSMTAPLSCIIGSQARTHHQFNCHVNLSQTFLNKFDCQIGTGLKRNGKYRKPIKATFPPALEFTKCVSLQLVVRSLQQMPAHVMNLHFRHLLLI